MTNQRLIKDTTEVTSVPMNLENFNSHLLPSFTFEEVAIHLFSCDDWILAFQIPFLARFFAGY